MPIEYLTLTEEERNKVIAQNIHAREVEHFHYDLNRQKYEALLAEQEMTELENDWPANILKYKAVSRDEAIARITDPPTLALVQRYLERDKLRALLASETVERDKVEKYHAKEIAAIPDRAKLDAALLAAQADRDAAKVARTSVKVE